MDRQDSDAQRPRDEVVDRRDVETEGETHATMGGAAAAGAVTGGVIGLAGGPVGAAIGAVGGAIVGAAAERMMHAEDANRRSVPEEGELDSGAARVRSPGETEQ
jgi:outer membrane lipoprotein SlyB